MSKKTVPPVSLQEITTDTVSEICKLTDTLPEYQRKFVASNAYSIAQAHFEPKAWFRGIYAGDEPVGFLMLYDDVEEQEYFLWRLMIAGPHQGKGFGKQAIELLLDYVRTRPGATSLLTSYVPDERGPGEFYRRLGFKPTGEILDGETVIKLDL
ncbi:MAG: GNAT family N-acetyltransferase [Anaerolineales bacterium]|jgi:diamine N-acetyltransferase